MRKRLIPARWSALLGAFLLALMPEQSVLAHGTGAHPSPTPTASPNPLSPTAKLLKNVVSTRAFRGGRLEGKAQLVSQIYSDESQKKYLLTNVRVRLPNSALGIKDKADAAATRLTLRYQHEGEATAYAECALDLRKASKHLAVYSLGMKSTSVETLVRWGNCDDPQSPGFDLTFPLGRLRDSATLLGPAGNTIARFAPPVSVDVALPGKKRKRAKPAAARLMEKGTYLMKKQ